MQTVPPILKWNMINVSIGLLKAWTSRGLDSLSLESLSHPRFLCHQRSTNITQMPKYSCTGKQRARSLCLFSRAQEILQVSLVLVCKDPDQECLCLRERLYHKCPLVKKPQQLSYSPFASGSQLRCSLLTPVVSLLQADLSLFCSSLALEREMGRSFPVLSAAVCNLQ